MLKNYSIQVKGKVQGVFYRAHTQKQAEKLQIKGFVMNMPDGSVIIEAEAEELILQEFIAWCKIGPERATVSSVVVNETALKNYKIFSIRY